jgi:hypothetical protein
VNWKKVVESENLALMGYFGNCLLGLIVLYLLH